MIAYLKKVSADDKKIIYQYSYLKPTYDGLIEIDLEAGTANITPSKGDERGEHMAKNAVGKIMNWNKDNKLPDKYTICIG